MIRSKNRPLFKTRGIVRFPTSLVAIRFMIIINFMVTIKISGNEPRYESLDDASWRLYIPIQNYVHPHSY